MTENNETPLPERPKLIFVNVNPSRGYGSDSIIVSDPLRVIPQPIEIPRSILPILELCDGTRTAYEIKGALLFQGIILNEDGILEALQQMDSALLFENGQYMKAKTDKLSSYLTDIEQLIVLGTDHNGGLGSITPTRQNYSTPFGTLRTDMVAVGEILENLDEETVDNEELHHLSEHSIELALVWAHYFIKKKT